MPGSHGTPVQRRTSTCKGVAGGRSIVARIAEARVCSQWSSLRDALGGRRTRRQRFPPTVERAVFLGVKRNAGTEHERMGTGLHSGVIAPEARWTRCPGRRRWRRASLDHPYGSEEERSARGYRFMGFGSLLCRARVSCWPMPMEFGWFAHR